MVQTGDRITVGNVVVRGLDVDPETRCAHYDSDRDVLAFAFPCCEPYYPCYRCHDAIADHDRTLWPRAARDRRAVLCGACGARSSIAAYLADPLACPACGVPFNPGCHEHHDRYFEG